jgi:serine/threonine protein kinase/tetratricopeptide (TPR) repeat protein
MFFPEQQIGNYFLIKRLGRGGFGEVWLAERRTKFVTTKVAVKLPLDEQVDHEIIKQETELWERASGHPNVLPIIEADEYDGQIVIVSEFAPDGSLEDLLNKKGGLLSVKQSVEMTIGILSGLEFLHSRNIIHRDLKPANVLLQGETPRLADFGISRVMKTNSASQNAAGTPFYMSPEAFDRKRNAQTDVWAIGVMLYQMLAGRLPFPSDNIAELMAAIVLREPEPLPPQIPIVLRQIIAKALAKQPSERYQTASQIKHALYNFLHKISSQTGSELTQTIELSTAKNPTVSFSDGEKKTIAILPFKNLSGDAASQFYEFSLADAVTTELARLRSLIVRPSSVIARYQNKVIDAREAGKEMRVDSILSAAFIHSGTHLRVTAQLLDVSTGDIIWSDRIDSDASDIFALQDAITQRILEGLKLTTGEKEHFGQRPTNNNEAYEEYLRGRDKFVRFIFRTLSPADCNAAIDSFKRAVELDPKFALAWSGLGACYANKVFKAIGDLQDYDFAETAFKKAIALDPNISEVRVLTGIIYLARGEKKKARAELARVRKQLPNDAAVYFLKGLMHRLDGEYDESLRSWDRLERLDPSSTVVACWNRARIYSLQGDNERALKELDCGAVVEPNHPFLKFFRAQILYYKGEVEEAARILKKVLAENPHLEGMRPLLAVFLAAQNKFAAARKNLSERVLKMAYADYDIAYWVASAYALLGEKDAAFEWLERAIKLGIEDLNWLETDKTLDSLRGDKRYAQLLEHIISQRA